MTTPTRADLERAAVAFFNDLTAQVERREGFDLDNLVVEIDLNLSESRRRIAELDAQLSANTFDGPVASAAQHILRDAGLTDDPGNAALPIIAQQLAARAEREQLALLVHLLTHPAKAYRHSDELFAPSQRASAVSNSAPPQLDTMPLSEAGAAYLKRKLRSGLTQTHVDELKRALGWLEQRFGSDRPTGAIPKTELARFRDVARLDLRMRGRDTPFDARLTDDVAFTDVANNASKINLLAGEAKDQCDAKDGLKDGVIGDPAACHVNLAPLACRPGQSGASCHAQRDRRGQGGL